MRIGVIGSMQYTERMLEARDTLIGLGHDAYVTELAAPFVGKTDEEKEVIKLRQKNTQNAIREFWRLMQGADAVLVMNLDKHGIAHYIGGNTFLEMGFAHVLGQAIYLFAPIPHIPLMVTEIVAMKPVVIDGDYTRIPLTATEIVR